MKNIMKNTMLSVGGDVGKLGLWNTSVNWAYFMIQQFYS